MRRSVRNLAAFFFGFALIAVPAFAFAGCVGTGCDAFDWDACTWVELPMTGGNYYEVNEQIPAGQGDWAVAPYVMKIEQQGAGSTTLRHQVQMTGTGWVGNAAAGTSGVSFSGAIYYASLESCGFNAETYEMVPLMPQDPALLMESFLYGFGAVGTFAVFGWACGAVLRAVKG